MSIPCDIRTTLVFTKGFNQWEDLISKQFFPNCSLPEVNVFSDNVESMIIDGYSSCRSRDNVFVEHNLGFPKYIRRTMRTKASTRPFSICCSLAVIPQAVDDIAASF